MPEGVNSSKDKSSTSIYSNDLSGLTNRYPILFVNRQVSEEALEMLYDGSIFSFEEDAISPLESLSILESLPQAALKRIKHLWLDIWMFWYVILSQEGC